MHTYYTLNTNESIINLQKRMFHNCVFQRDMEKIVHLVKKMIQIVHIVIK